MTAKQGKSPSLADFIGAVSRWCDLTGNVPDVSADQNKAAQEFEAFNRWLSEQAAEKQQPQTWEF